jgi:hypothetical protein
MSEADQSSSAPCVKRLHFTSVEALEDWLRTSEVGRSCVTRAAWEGWNHPGSSEMLDIPPPHNPDAERLVVGCIIRFWSQASIRAAVNLSPDLFWVWSCRKLLERLYNVRVRREAFTSRSLAALARSAGVALQDVECCLRAARTPLIARWSPEAKQIVCVAMVTAIDQIVRSARKRDRMGVALELLQIAYNA